MTTNSNPINSDLENSPKDPEVTEFIDGEIISKLDMLKYSDNIYKKYSEIYKGGVYALKDRGNPDWMSQSANSFREIFYILNNREKDNIEQILNSYLKKSLTQEEVNKYRGYLTDLYKLFTDVAHHFSTVEDMETRVYIINEGTVLKAKDLTDEDYLNAVKLLKEYIKILVVNAIDIHAKIDDCVKNNKQDKELIKVFVDSSEDSKRYFFSFVDKTWLKWLCDNGFFNVLRGKDEDAEKTSYRKPELEYLVRMATEDPEMVVNIINSVNISSENLNPEVVERFFWITGSLPAPNMKKILPKILKEDWSRLMSGCSRSGYEYVRITETLLASKDYESLVILAQIILTPKNKGDFDNVDRFSISDNLFLSHDITHTGIFDAITDSDNPLKEKSLEVFSKILCYVIDLGKGTENSFQKPQPFYLFDVDIFSLDLNSRKISHHREDIQNFIATIKELIDVNFSILSENQNESRRMYSQYIEIFPDSISCWKLKLYAMTRNPKFFKTEIKEALFRVFESGDRYSDITGGAEYHQALSAGFGSLDSSVQQEYIKNLIDYFGANLEDKEIERWRRRDGLKIAFYIKTYISAEEIIEIEEKFGKIPVDGTLKPHPSIGEVLGGMVSPKSHVNLADFSVEEIIEHLKTDWTPAILNEQFKNDDFLQPRGVEGLSDAIKEDVKFRLGSYLYSLNNFFDREKIAPCYPYSILREIDEMMRNRKYLSHEQYQELLNFFELIRVSGETDKFEDGDRHSWSPDWISVHKMIADILILILVDMKDAEVFKVNRDKILLLIKYLLTIDSSPDEEDDQTEERDSGSVAINSVRGQAYHAFAQFAHNDSKSLADDVKMVHEFVLDNDSSNAVRFTTGQFLASFYFRDTTYIQELLQKIFPSGNTDESSQKRFFATWEGYLSSPLHKEIFTEMEKKYEYAINLEDYPERKYLRDLDELLSIHIALAYAHFDLKIGDPLFTQFWEVKNDVRHHEFVSFIGRTCLNRNQGGEEWLIENNVSKDKLIQFWDWVLSQDFEPKTYSGFGLWINPKINLIDENEIIERLPKTLEKSEGDFEWDYGFIQKLKVFANLNSQNTLKCIELYLLTKDGELNPHRELPMFSVDDEIKDALAICYKNPTTKQDTENLIAKLIDKGSSAFWSLKDALK